MVLLLDVGNTNIKIGVLSSGKLSETWRIATDHAKTADEFGMLLGSLLTSIGCKFSAVDGVIISSVAPSLNYTVEHMCTHYIKKTPLYVGSKIKLPITIGYDNPDELGADRIVTASAAYVQYGGPVIVADFGSATTFGAVSASGVFLGGAIAPGIKASAESLTASTAKLPRIELLKPKSPIGTNTVNNMQAGIIYGFAGVVDKILKEMKKSKELKGAKVIATGGLSELISDVLDVPFDAIDRPLSLNGLKILYELNNKK